MVPRHPLTELYDRVQRLAQVVRGDAHDLLQPGLADAQRLVA